MSIKKIFFTLLLTCFYGLCHAQILDDSTKQVYGLKTTRYILEYDILNNRKTYYNPDSTLDGFHLFDRNLKSGWLYQDLGLIGTAVKPLFFQPNEEVSKQLGFSTYGFYAFDATKTKYYNTKSPYTNMYYSQSGGGMLYLDFTHSQNIKPRWNVTFDVRRLTAAKQYGAPQTREERLVDSWALTTSSNYESKDGKYTILGTYNHFNHAPIDQGGIKPLVDSLKFVESSDLSNYKNFLSRITNASSRDWRNEFHIYQQYQLSNGFQVYHILDYQRRIDYYHDNNFKSDTTAGGINYYGMQIPKDTALLNKLPDTLSLALRYRLIENKFGIKGIFKGFAYRLNLRYRLYNLNSDFNVDEPSQRKTGFRHEVLASAWANYFFPDSLKRAYAEFELGTNLNYRLKVEYIGPKLTAGFYQASTPATLLDERLGNNSAFNWSMLNNRNLANQFSTNLYAATSIRLQRFKVTPSGYYSLLSSYIYYDENAHIQQTPALSALFKSISVFRAGLEIEYNWKKFLLRNQTYLAGTSRQDIIRMPTITNNTTVGYEFIYAKRLHINAGAEIYYRSAYYADNYMPLNRQFYIQNDKKAWGYPVVDLFANLKVSRVRVFLKFAHVNQGFPANGYFVSSVYPGLRRTFFIGANWPLFD
ncbi:putative porin [Emticicia fontis]